MDLTDDFVFQKLEEKAKKAEEALEAEVKVRKDLEGLNSKLLAEKTALLDSLAGEKGSLQEYQEKSAKLQAQKNDLDNQLRVSITFFIWNLLFCFLNGARVSECVEITIYLMNSHTGHSRTFVTRGRCP